MSRWRRNDPLSRPTPDAPSGYASAVRRAIGLGSAKTGAEHWWLQRVTAAGLVPLMVWFLATVVAHVGSGPAAVTAWLSQPWAALPMIGLLFLLFQHTRLGLQVIVEDYVHSDRARFTLVSIVHGVCYALMVIGIFSVLSIALR